MRKVKTLLWNAGGACFVGIGTLGIFIPLLPTVVFYLIAVFCFSKGNPAWAERLYQHPIHGHHLRAWRDHGAISRKGKVAALLTMGLSLIVVGVTAGPIWALIPLAVMATVGTWIWTRPE